MTTFLQPHERFVYTGAISIRGPDGTPLDNVPQYVIRDRSEAAPGSDTGPACADDINLITVGTFHTDFKTAKERYAAALAGKPNMYFDGSPIYAAVDTEEINLDTGLTNEEERTYLDLITKVVNKLGKDENHDTKDDHSVF